MSYGRDEFKPEMFAFAVPDRKTNYLNKPLGGLWASPTDSKWGWKDWCLSERFNVSSLAHSFEFKLSDTARIYVIDNEDDLVRISNAENNIGQYGIDYDMLLKEGFDGFIGKPIDINEFERTMRTVLPRGAADEEGGRA